MIFSRFFLLLASASIFSHNGYSYLFVIIQEEGNSSLVVVISVLLLAELHVLEVPTNCWEDNSHKPLQVSLNREAETPV